MSATGNRHSVAGWMDAERGLAEAKDETTSNGTTPPMSPGEAKSQIPPGDAPPPESNNAEGHEPPAPPIHPVAAQSEPPAAYPGRTRGTILVLIAFGISITAGIGFVFVYWMRGSNMLLGTTLALCLLGFGSALVFWSHWLMRQTEVSAPREPIPSAPEEYEALFEEIYPAEPSIQRRKLLVGMSAAVVTTLAAAWISVLRSFFGNSPYGAPLSSKIWKHGQRLVTETGDIASIHSLQPGGAVIVFPENHKGYVSAQTVLLRVHEQFLRLPKSRAGWAPGGYLAYSRVCTHAGCPVGLFEAENDLLLCPCHQSTFNVLNGAQPTGGPAARPLPQLPLYVDEDGNLRAAGDFTAPPGPGYWSMPS